MKWISVLALAAFVAAFVIYYPGPVGDIMRFGMYVVIEENATFVGYNPYYAGGGVWESTPGVAASAWLPDGSTIEYVYRRAMALFNVTEIDPRRDFEWRWFPFQDPGVLVRLPASAFYGLQVAVKVGEGPVLKAVLVRRNVQFYSTTVNLWNATGPCPECAEIILLSVTYNYMYNGSNKLCVSIFPFKQEEWYRLRNYNWSKFDVACWEAPPPRNITIIARGDRVEAWTDNSLIYVLETQGWLYTGPYYIFDFGLTTAQAFITAILGAIAKKPLGRVWLFIGNDTLAPPKYALSHGYYVMSFLSLNRMLEAAADFDGVSTYVKPGRPEVRLVTNPDVEVRLFGKPTVLTRGAFLKCPMGEPMARGNLTPFWGGFLALGPGSLACTEYPVAVRTAGGVRTFAARANSTFTWQPPPEVVNDTRYFYKPVSLYVEGPVEITASVDRVEYRVRLEYPWGVEEAWASGPLELPGRFVELGNGTAYKTPPFTLYVDRPASIRPNYTKYYAVAHKTPLGVNKTWVLPGSAIEPGPRLVDLGNGTALLLKPVYVRVRLPGGGEISGSFSARAYGPAEVIYSGERMYAAFVETPLGINKTWILPGARFEYSPPAFLDLGNGTALRGPNGTCAFVVTRPVKCAVSYSERLYRVRIATPVNASELWTSGVYRPPAVIDLGNGTRLVDPSPSVVTVDRPLSLHISYRRQHWVEVRGVEEWRGWAYEGSVIRLNGTVIDGVKYTPLTPQVVVKGPVSVAMKYKAEFQTVASDPLGVPNPTAEVVLCGRVYRADAAGRVYATAETDRLCQLEARQWPLSPYTLAALSAVATAAALALRRRR
ncbi:hypothetical protein [Pyrobaculum sp.]|uniref:hypothetical protein n=1 Tax=Pyrobaculum sp. TaxID=2004705 RepID=UPI003167CFCC